MTVTSQPQKKNKAVSAPVAKSCGVNAPGDSQAHDNACAGCAPNFDTANAISAIRMTVSTTVMATCE